MIWLCLKFNNLPLEIFSHKAKNSARVAVITDGKNSKVLACNKKAESIGVKIGMSLPLLYELTPEIRIHKRQRSKEIAKLRELARWSLKFTSQVTVSSPDSLLLEIGGSLKIFKTIQKIIQKIKNDLKKIGYTATMSVGPTPLSAQYFAECRLEIIIQTQRELSRTLGRLPASTLEENPKSSLLLSQIGISSIQQLRGLPRKEVIHRFGNKLLANSDKALGRTPDPQKNFIPKKKFITSIDTPYSIRDSEKFLTAINKPLEQLILKLSIQERGLITLEITTKKHDKKTLITHISTNQPTRDQQYITSLIREKLNQIKIKPSFESIILEATEISNLMAQNKSMFSVSDPSKEKKQTEIIDIIRTRLGEESLYSLCEYQDFRPELAWGQVEPGNTISRKSIDLLRPFWLLPQPQHIRNYSKKLWINGELSIIDGPETIESGWWDNREIKRDYFIARNPGGAKFWIYQERHEPKNWYLHGIFS